MNSDLNGYVRALDRTIRRRSLESVHYLRLAAANERHVHVVRERATPINWEFFEWLARRYPEISRRFRQSTARSPQVWLTRGAGLLIPWLNDPVLERDRRLFDRMMDVQSIHDADGIPVVNRVESVSAAIKSRALEVIRACGIRAARTIPLSAASRFDDISSHLGAPFIVRNDQGHGGYVELIESAAGFENVQWKALHSPVALEFIETRSGDGLYRKYRYFLAGSRGIARHLVIGRSWILHAADRVRGERWIDEEMSYLERPDPHHEVLDRVRQALGLDVVAFDYSIDSEGRLVVWEPNPFPSLWSPFNQRDPYYDYQLPHLDRVFRTLLLYYLDTAGIDATGIEP